jgi:hypothetical protein
MLRLTPLDAVSEALETSADRIRIGRAAENDLTVTAHHVSGEHASIVFTGDTDREVLRALYQAQKRISGASTSRASSTPWRSRCSSSSRAPRT